MSAPDPGGHFRRFFPIPEGRRLKAFADMRQRNVPAECDPADLQIFSGISVHLFSQKNIAEIQQNARITTHARASAP
jgi:hypothetical protein